jgi:hypothetical protein
MTFKEFSKFIERNGLQAPLGVGLMFIMIAIAAAILIGVIGYFTPTIKRDVTTQDQVQRNGQELQEDHLPEAE